MYKRFLRFFILVTFYVFNVFIFFNVFIYKNIDKTVSKWRETLVSNSNKAMTFRQLSRTVLFLAHPVGILCENGVGKISKVLWHSLSFLVLILHTGMVLNKL